MASADSERKTYGILTEHEYDDWEGISEMINLPDSWEHRSVDKAVVSAGETNPGKLFTAIVCPPCIYGPGRGPDNQRSVQAYNLSRGILTRGRGFKINEGENIWHEIHIQDLSSLYLALVTESLQPGGGKATWNSQGYYFAENGPIVWGEISKKIAKIAADKKFIPNAEVDSLPPGDANELVRGAAFLLGTNARCKAIRGNKLLGWTPKEKCLTDLLPDIVEEEAKALGMIKGHAERVSG